MFWWSYDVSPPTRGGYYERHQALALVAKMGFVITALTSFVWVVMRRRNVSSPPWRRIWRVARRTLLILVVHASVILLRLQFSNEPFTDAKVCGGMWSNNGMCLGSSLLPASLDASGLPTEQIAADGKSPSCSRFISYCCGTEPSNGLRHLP